MTYDNKRARLTPNSPEYQRVHRWVVKQSGKATHCSSGCRAKRYTWSNISRDYLLDMSDWEQVCDSCHKKRDKLTQEGSQRISEANKINSIGNRNAAKPIECIDTKVSYFSTREAARSLGILSTSIQNCLKGITKTSGGYHWRRRIIS